MSALTFELRHNHVSQFGLDASVSTPVRMSDWTSLVLPVDQRVILASVVLYLEHPDAWYVPLEVELDQCSRGRGLSCHHSFINPALHIACHVAAISAASGRCRNVG